jgi:hypothetical protein
MSRTSLGPWISGETTNPEAQSQRLGIRSNVRMRTYTDHEILEPLRLALPIATWLGWEGAVTASGTSIWDVGQWRADPHRRRRDPGTSQTPSAEREGDRPPNSLSPIAGVTRAHAERPATYAALTGRPADMAPCSARIRGERDRSAGGVLDNPDRGEGLAALAGAEGPKRLCRRLRPTIAIRASPPAELPTSTLPTSTHRDVAKGVMGVLKGERGKRSLVQRLAPAVLPP